MAPICQKKLQLQQVNSQKASWGLFFLLAIKFTNSQQFAFEHDLQHAECAALYIRASNLVGGLMMPVWMIKFYNNKTAELLIQEEWPLSKGQARNQSILFFWVHKELV